MIGISGVSDVLSEISTELRILIRE